MKIIAIMYFFFFCLPASALYSEQCPKCHRRSIPHGIVMSAKGFGKQSVNAKELKKTSKDSQIYQPQDKRTPNLGVRIEESISNHFPSLNTSFPGLRALHIDPPILEVLNFLSNDVCDEYVSLATSEGYQIPSQTFGYGSGSVRTSTTWYMTYSTVNKFVKKTHELLRCPWNRFEEPQIVRYEFGQQFSWHYDTIPKSLVTSSGQRMATILVYLNNVTGGGATVFKELGVSITPEKGKAVIFFPSYKDGRPDERTLHAGQVTMSTKWIAQMWIHENEYKPTLPPGNEHIEL